MVHIAKPNLYDLIDLHIRARGCKVYDKKEADVVFDLDTGITPFDTEVFMGGIFYNGFLLGYIGSSFFFG